MDLRHLRGFWQPNDFTIARAAEKLHFEQSPLARVIKEPEEELGVGKPKKLALTACMRKLLTILDAMMRTNLPWRDIDESPSIDRA